MKSLDPMLRPRSVAIVGASERTGSVGDQTVRQLISGGFTGPVFPVNPRYPEVHGLKCFGSLQDLPEPVDLAVLAVGNGHLEAEMEKAVALGARSVAIFASCHGETSTGVPLRDRIRELAAKADVPICGGNGMGFLNVEDRIRICGFHQPAELRQGGVAFLSHSGSLFSAMLHNRRGIRFSLVVSTGLEINTSMDSYMDWAMSMERTQVLALFLETIRNPVGFRVALEEADSRDIPVVALKIGASDRGREAVATHSEGLAGEDAVYEALFEAHGVHRVWSMDEMADTLELLAAGRRAPALGMGAVLDSGGERALLIDTSERVGVSLPDVGDATTRRLAALLDPGLEPANPVDAWGTGRNAEAVFIEALLALGDDPAIGALVFCVDLTADETPDEAYSNAAFAATAATPKPMAVMGNLRSAIDPGQAARLRDGGISVLEGTETGLRAVGHLLSRHRRTQLPPLEERLTEARLANEVAVDDHVAALGLLATYGIPTATTHFADGRESLLEAGRKVGFPLVLKTAEPIAHKTEVGGVMTGIVGEQALLDAYADLASRLGPRASVSEQVDGGVELALGMVNDDQFGPVVIISAGGTLVELMSDRVALLPRLDKRRALAALDRLRIRPLLDGARGAAAADLDALADVIARFSELAMDGSADIRAMDVNPVIAGPGMAVAVDALVKWR